MGCVILSCPGICRISESLDSHGSLTIPPVEGCTSFIADCRCSGNARSGADTLHRSAAGATAIRSRTGSGIVGRATPIAGAETHPAAGDDAGAVLGLGRRQELSELSSFSDPGAVWTAVWPGIGGCGADRFLA